MKKLRLFFAVALIAATNQVSAQVTTQNGFEDFVRGGTDDANILFNYYMMPVMKGIGYGFNNGWYNTAEPHQTLGFDLTFCLNAALVPEADQVFEFIDSEYSNTRLQAGSSNPLPTAMGGTTDAILENYVNNQDIDPLLPPGETVIGDYPAPNGIAEEIKPYSFNQIAVPSPIVQIGLGLVKGTEIKVRWLPTISRDDFNFKYIGVGGMHSISQWIPGLKDLPLDISAFVGYTKIDAEYNIPPGNIEGDGQRAEFTVNTLTYQALVSAHISVLTVYAGLGMDNFTTKFRLLGTYNVYPSSPVPIEPFTDPIDLKQSGNNGFRTTLGLRVKLAIITIHADYTFREYNTLTAGIGFSVR